MISVIIVNYGSAALAKRAVESVYRENEEIEVIVVDNTATSEEQEYLRNIFKAPEVTLIFNKENLGFARACNQAFSLSRGEYVFLLNPDAYVISPCLRNLREFMEKMPGVGSVSPFLFWDSAATYLFPYTFLPSPIHDIWIKLSHISPFVRNLYSNYGRRKNISLWTSSVPVKAQNLSGGTVLLPRSAIESVGGLFDERFFLFYEDNDLFLRLKKAGYSLYILPDAKAVHSYFHAAFKLDIMEQSRKLYYGKHYGNSLLRRISSRLPSSSPRIESVDCGTWKTPPIFPVPHELRGAYLFEWSHYHLFMPSVGHFGIGETFIFSEEIWHSLDCGTYYSRFSDHRRMCCPSKILLWRKGADA